MPILNITDIVNQGLDSLAVLVITKHTVAFLFKVSQFIKDSTDRVMLFIAPTFPELFKRLWIEPRMNKLPGFKWLVRNCPVDLIDVLVKNIKQRVVVFFDDTPLTRILKCKRFIDIVTNPCLIIAGRDSKVTGKEQSAWRQ